MPYSMSAFSNIHPLNWFPYEVTGSIELLLTYVNDLEMQIARGVVDYKTKAITEAVEQTYSDDQSRVVTHHLGLCDTEWDLRSIFVEYYPNLQRRSALIALFAFFESELDKLCKRVKNVDGHKIDLVDIAGKGIFRSTTYLLKVARIEGVRDSCQWHEVMQIQAIRNQIVHSGGRLPKSNDPKAEKLKAYIENSKFVLLSDEGEIILSEGYLGSCISTFKVYFSSLHEAMCRKYKDDAAPGFRVALGSEVL